MTDQQYLVSSTHVRVDRHRLPGELPLSSTTSSTADQPPESAAYSDLATTSSGGTSSSFGRTQHCDFSILTPVSSGAGSPPLRHRPHPARHHRSVIKPQHQSLTPPPTSKMYWSHDFSMAPPNGQPESPLIMHSMPPQSHFHLSALSDASAEPHHKEDIADPPEPYWGSFGVSTTQPESVTASAETMHHQVYYVDGMQHQMGHVHQTLAPSALDIKQEPADLSMAMPHQQQHDHHHPQQQHLHQQQHMSSHMIQDDEGPLLASPTAQQMRLPQTKSPKPGDIIEPNDCPPPLEPPFPFKFKQASKPEQGSNRLYRKPRVRGGATRHAGQGSGRGGSTRSKPTARSSDPTVQETPAADTTAPNEPLQFKDGMPEADRFLFDLRRKYDNNKGKGMWGPITTEYNKRFGTDFDRAALQMRISRAKSKYVQWGEKDDQILVEAARQVERQYYRQVHLKYKELGGNPQADFNVGNVEMRMVELGLSHVFMEPWKGDPKMSTRRRRKLNERQRQTTSKDEGNDRGQESAPAPQGTGYHHHHQYPQQSMQPATSDNATRSSTYTAELSPSVRQQVLDEIEGREYDLEPSQDGHFGAGGNENKA